MSSNELPLDYMAMEPVRQGSTSLSLSIVTGASCRVLNSDYLRVVSFQGEESVSEPYSFTITLRANEFNPSSNSRANLNPGSNFSGLPEQSYSTTDWLRLIQGTAEALLGQWATITIGNEFHDPSANDKIEALGEDALKEVTSDIDVMDEVIDILHQLFPQPVWIATELKSHNDDILIVDSVSGPQVFASDYGDAKSSASNTSLNVTPLTLPLRYFSGLISSITQSAPGEYTLVMQSPLYPLMLRNKYYIYKGVNIQDVIKALITPDLERYSKHYNVQFNIAGLAATRTQDWMQAGESDFAMLQRVMKVAAVHFYFIYTESSVTVVFSNQPSNPKSVFIPGTPNGTLGLRYSYTSAEALNLQQNDLFCNLSYQVQMTSQTLGPINTVLTQQESVWETNNVATFDSYPAQSPSLSTSYNHHRVFNYGLERINGDSESSETLRQIQQALASQQRVLSGECTSNLLSPGYTFSLSQQAIDPKLPVRNQMPEQFNGMSFVVTKIKHQVSESSPYSGSVEASPIFTGKDTTSPEATLITPFDMSDTRQGSVLAKVLQTAIPNSPYFFQKGNFDPQTSSVQYGGNTVMPGQMGCIVQFATDEGTDITHWVALADSSQTAPAVHSMVLIGRSENESEIPQIQQVVASHGEKTIQPAILKGNKTNPVWRKNSWTFNTSWGSSCNTNYGDSKNIHFSNEISSPDLSFATTIVNTAYEKPNAIGGLYSGVSYDEGSYFNYSTTSKGMDGLASASVSHGSHFSESYSQQDYSVNYTKLRQGFSKTQRSVNVSVIGDLDDDPDKKLDNKSISFIDGKMPNQEIIDICNSLPDGSTYDESHIKCKTISLSGHGTKPPAIAVLDITADAYSNSLMVGNSEDIHEQTGDVTSTSTITGNTTNTSTVSLNVSNANTVMGKSINVNGIGVEAPALPESLSVVSYSSSLVSGDSSDTHNQTGTATNSSTITKSINVSGIGTAAPAVPASVTSASYSHSIIQGNSTDKHEQTGDVNSTSTITGSQTQYFKVTSNSKMTNIVNGDSTNVSENYGEVKHTETHHGHKEINVTHIGTKNSISKTLAASHEFELSLAASSSEKVIGGISNEVKSFNGLSNEVNQHSGPSNKTNIGPASAFTDERPQAIQIAITNITVTGIISIL